MENIKNNRPTRNERVLRLWVEQLANNHSADWLYHQCCEKQLLSAFYAYQEKGIFDMLSKGSQHPFFPPRLDVELVPRSCWYHNLRSQLSAAAWEEIKELTAKKANYRCEICQGRGKRWPVECHETWYYDDDRKVQSLAGLVALCPACHAVKHFGYAELQGKQAEATCHLAIVNQWSYSDAVYYLEAQFERWARRSQQAWQLDISWLHQKPFDFLQENTK